MFGLFVFSGLSKPHLPSLLCSSIPCALNPSAAGTFRLPISTSFGCSEPYPILHLLHLQHCQHLDSMNRHLLPTLLCHYSVSSPNSSFIEAVLLKLSSILCLHCDIHLLTKLKETRWAWAQGGSEWNVISQSIHRSLRGHWVVWLWKRCKQHATAFTLLDLKSTKCLWKILDQCGVALSITAVRKWSQNLNGRLSLLSR